MAEPPATYFVRWAEATGQQLEWLAQGVVRPEGFEPPTFWLGVQVPRCFICGGPHDLDDCPQYGDLDDLIDLEHQLVTA